MAVRLSTPTLLAAQEARHRLQLLSQEEEPHDLSDFWDLGVFSHVRISLARICKEKGHDWDSDFHAGPDSAHEQHECTRCGDTWSHTWY